MKKTSRVVPVQVKKLLDLLSEERVLSEDGKITYLGTTRQNFWKRIATQLNAVNGGVHKNTWQWYKVWVDWKARSKKKANILLRKRNYKNEQKIQSFTDLELRLLKMINYPIDGSIESIQLETLVNSADNVENTETELQTQDNLNEDSVVERGSPNDDDKTDHSVDNKTDFCRVNIRENRDFEDSSSESDGEEKVKRKDKSYYKREKISLDEFKTKTAMELEKEKLQLKAEELRLRAIELKVKGDELKLKELEMNKINYLTNIEEEKLKCLRDISSCLKELVERNRSGNVRFSNIML